MIPALYKPAQSRKYGRNPLGSLRSYQIKGPRSSGTTPWVTMSRHVRPVHITILIFDGFHELDSLTAKVLTHPLDPRVPGKRLERAPRIGFGHGGHGEDTVPAAPESWTASGRPGPGVAGAPLQGRPQQLQSGRADRCLALQKMHDKFHYHGCNFFVTSRTDQAIAQVSPSPDLGRTSGAPLPAPYLTRRRSGPASHRRLGRGRLDPPRPQRAHHRPDWLRQDLLQLLDDRAGRRSTLITSQMPTRAWHQWLANDLWDTSSVQEALHHEQQSFSASQSVQEVELHCRISRFKRKFSKTSKFIGKA
jgi:hypothetical protein